MATNLPPPGPLTYEGQIVTPNIRRTTSPTTANNGFPVPTIWINTAIKKAWVLVSVALGIADWVPIGGDPGEVDTITVDAHTAPGTNPVVPDSNASIIVTGGQVAAGTTTNVIRTDSLAANTFTIEIQRSQAVASTTVGDNGVCHFNSADFNVDSNGFVSAASSGFERTVGVDAHTSPGTSPVIPTAGGLITVTGGQVAAGTTTNVIRTDSLAANTYTVEIQRSQAVASTTIGDNGVSHFNSADFSVDANGFVSAASAGYTRTVGVDAHTGPGTSPVVPTAGGLITVTGASSAAGSIPVQTNSLAANTYTVQVQKSQAIAATDATKVGLCNFYNGHFSVDANGFVVATGGTAFSQIAVQTFTTPGANTYTPTFGMRYCLVEIVGGGGGGGSLVMPNAAFAASGGGGGGYSKRSFSAAAIGVSQTVTIGSGGVASTGGGTTSFGAFMSATGGSPGADWTQFEVPIAGVGGVGSGGDVNTVGTPGLMSGSNVGGPAYRIGGNGGCSYFGGGALGFASTTNAATPATDATSYGGGGSGAANVSSVACAGGAGFSGICIVTEYI